MPENTPHETVPEAVPETTPDLPRTLVLRIDGRLQRVAGVPVSLTLLDYLRASGRPASKEGCAEGDCGACTVALRRGNRFLAVNSCLLPLAAVAGQEVVTAAGLARSGALHPVQDALARAGGSQCGYCTPGFVMSLFAAFYDGGADGVDPDAALEGNLCRCTGYLPIRAAARSLGAPAADDPFAAQLRSEGINSSAGESRGYRHEDERFFRPTTIAEALVLLERYPEATPLAGGTDLGVEINKFGRRYPVLVSLDDVPELTRLEETEAGLELGGGLTLSQLEAQLSGRAPLLETMLKAFAARQIRNRATLAGNLASASPVGDLAPVLLAGDAQLTLASTAGERRVPLHDFFTGYRTTVRLRTELIKSVTLPAAPPGQLMGVYKVAKRGADDISTVAAAFCVRLEGGAVASARLAYGGVAATPVRALGVEDALRGRPWSAAVAADAARELRELFTPLSDLRGSAAYRRALVGNLFEKFFYDHPHAPAEVAA